MTMKIIEKLKDCPAGEYYYLLELVKDCSFRGGHKKGFVFYFSPEDAFGDDFEGEKQRICYNLREVFCFDDDCYKIYQFDEKEECEYFLSKFTLVGKLMK